MKSVLKSAIGRLGYKIYSKKSVIPADLSGQIDNPLLAKYAARNKSFLIDADFENCIGLYQYSCEKYGDNPLVNTITDYLKNGMDGFEGSKLEDFYHHCSPDSAAEWFNLEGKIHNDLTELPTYSAVFPWENATMKGRKRYRERNVSSETQKRGKSLSVEHGIELIGPFSKERGELEVNTLIELTKSIQKKGYRRGNHQSDDISSSVLIDEDSYKFLINDGNHRIAALSALDYKSVPVRVEPTSIPAFIYRNEVDYWPKVKEGLYTRKQALSIFDAIFRGDGFYSELHFRSNSH